MRIDRTLLDSLTLQAKQSPRLRANYDLRTTPDVSSQRMLNAIEPGTIVPIHRHMDTTEAMVVIRGSATQYIFNDEGIIVDEIHMKAGSDLTAMLVERGVWHRLVSHESGTVILECKDGAFQPLKNEDILTIS